MDNLCKSCSGLLSDFNEEDIIAEGFCPHCVDKQGKLKSYKDILDGMIEYIEEDHPEISEDKKLDQAVTWLREGPIWGEKFVGSATMQALEEAHLREIVEVLPSNPAEDIVKIVFYRTELDTVLEALKSRLV
ncbi:hypothetical protein KC622_02650, partial [Candidatus Dojkabacteria bacterium]|nr:hypothetical protein [Candidatus Dojkabacteria bacterium]